MAADKIAFPNLRAEMARSGVSIQNIADAIGTGRDTAGAKLACKRPLYLTEAFVIADTYFQGANLRELFERK